VGDRVRLEHLFSLSGWLQVPAVSHVWGPPPPGAIVDHRRAGPQGGPCSLSSSAVGRVALWCGASTISVLSERRSEAANRPLRAGRRGSRVPRTRRSWSGAGGRRERQALASRTCLVVHRAPRPCQAAGRTERTAAKASQTVDVALSVNRHGSPKPCATSEAAVLASRRHHRLAATGAKTPVLAFRCPGRGMPPSPGGASRRQSPGGKVSNGAVAHGIGQPGHCGRPAAASPPRKTPGLGKGCLRWWRGVERRGRSS